MAANITLIKHVATNSYTGDQVDLKTKGVSFNCPFDTPFACIDLGGSETMDF